MRKETHKIVTAFIEGRVAKTTRTRTDGEAIYLHDNRIAWREGNHIYATMCGWGSVTTRERLNGLCRALGLPRGFYQAKHTQYYGEHEISTREVIELI